MKMKFLWITAILLHFSSGLFSQRAWTLKDCIDYARQENIQVKKLGLSVETYEESLKQAKAELFPSLNGRLSQDYNHARDKNDNYRYQGSLGGQYALNASWVLYNGKQNLNSIKQTKLQQEAEALNREQQRNDIEIAITQTYLQLLYANESIKNNENIAASSKAQLTQTADFLQAGSITRAEYAQVEAQYSSDKYNLILAQNSFDNYKLQLKQLLEFGIDQELVVAFPDIRDEDIQAIIPPKYEVYQSALAIMPEVRSSKLNKEIAELGKASARGGYLPTLSLEGSIGTSNQWNHNSSSFSTQIDRNFSQYLGLSVSIPIFDNRKNKSNVRKSDLQVQMALLNQTETEKELLRTIESLHQDAVSAQSKYHAAKDKLHSAELSYTLVREQYATGMRNTVELTTEQNNYANALQDLLQAKYAALLSRKLLHFYQGEEISL